MSKKRAKSVYLALIDYGVPNKQLTYKGYGERKPIADNETVEGRFLNRRTSFTIF